MGVSLSIEVSKPNDRADGVKKDAKHGKVGPDPNWGSGEVKETLTIRFLHVKIRVGTFPAHKARTR
jgi:hypothetical protein